MEKEVRAMLEKGEKVTLVAIDECVMRNCSNFKALIIGKEYLIDDYEGLKKFFKLKQPKDPNELPEKKTKKDKFLKLLKKYNWVVKIEKEQKLGSCADIYAENKCDLTNYFMIIDDGNVKNVLNEAVYHIYVNNFDFKIFEGVINSEKEFKNTMHTLGFEKKTKTQRIEELEKRVEQLENKLNNFAFGLDFAQGESIQVETEIKQAPEFWYVDIQEEKDSELLPTFKEWFAKKVGFGIHFDYYKYGFSGAGHYDGYDWDGYDWVTITRDWEANSDKMQKITLNEWDSWFNK
jgi:hypothetical protein